MYGDPQQACHCRDHDVRFDTEPESRGCDGANLLTRANHPTLDLLKWHRRLDRNLSQCEKGDGMNGGRRPYKYDWKKPPLECCEELVKEHGERAKEGGQFRQRNY